MSKYKERLLEEWIRHGKLIICVDFDDTLINYKLNNHSDQEKCLELIRIAKELGAYIIIYTARHIDNWMEIQEHCESIKLPIDGINKIPLELPYGNHGKLYYNIFLDDRAGLQSAMDILDSVITQYQQYLDEKYKQPYTT